MRMIIMTILLLAGVTQLASYSENPIFGSDSSGADEMGLDAMAVSRLDAAASW